MKKPNTCCKITDVEEENEICIKWHILDVKNVRPDLTDEECREVLKNVLKYHDADVGVSWYTLEHWADELYGTP